MKKWIKAFQFTVTFCALAYIGGCMFTLGSQNAARMVGITIVMGVDQGAGGEK